MIINAFETNYQASAQFKWKPFIILLLLITFFSQSSPALAQIKERRCNYSQQLMVKRHITKQISALANSDWKSAYSYAAQSFQDSISAEQFKEIIERGYDFLIENEGLAFGACRTSKTTFTQLVTVDSMGAKYQLSYKLVVNGKRLGITAANQLTPNANTVV